MLKKTVVEPTIVQVVPYYPPHLGGMENCAAKIAEGFAEKGYATNVYTSNIGSSKCLNSSIGPKVYYLRSIEIAHTPILFALFFRLLTLPSRALIHLHVAQAFSPEIVYLISKIRKIPYVAHVHLDVDPSGPFGFLLETYKKFFLRKVLRSAAKVICLTEPQKHLIASKYMLPVEAIAVVPNGVASEYFVDKRTLENKVPRVLFVGRLAPQKNLSLLISAVAQMKVYVQLDIIGEGEERAKLEDLIRKCELQNVTLHGKKTGNELLEMYKSADIFVLPSLKEGVSLSMLEALATGLPVVASASPDMQQILNECGVLIEEPTASNYAKAIDELLSKKDILKNLSNSAVQKAHSYSWENVLNSIEDIYKEVYYESR